MGAAPDHRLRLPVRAFFTFVCADAGHPGAGVGMPGPPARGPPERTPAGRHLLWNPGRRDPDDDLQLLAGDLQPSHTPVRHRCHPPGICALHGNQPCAPAPKPGSWLPRFSGSVDRVRLGALAGLPRLPVGDARNIAICGHTAHPDRFPGRSVGCHVFRHLHKQRDCLVRFRAAAGGAKRLGPG